MSNVAVSRARLLGGLLLLLLATGCRSVAPVLKIGLVAPFEGHDRAIGYDVIYSARLAVRTINDSGGVAGHRLALVAYDDSGDPALAADVARALVVDEDVIAVLGHWQAETTAAAAPIYAAAGLPLLPMGRPPLAAVPPESLPPAFIAAYEQVTPFDETAGPFAATAYDAVGLVQAALAQAAMAQGALTQGGADGALDRPAVAAVLASVTIDGISGRLSLAPDR